MVEEEKDEEEDRVEEDEAGVWGQVVKEKSRRMMKR